VNSPITVTFESLIAQGDAYDSISLNDKDGKAVSITKMISGNKLIIQARDLLKCSSDYTLKIPADSVKNAENDMPVDDQEIKFRTKADSFDYYPLPDTNPSNASVKSGTFTGKIPLTTNAAKGLTTVKLDSAILGQATGALSIEMPKTTGATSYAVELPAAVLVSGKENRTIEMICENGTIKLPGNMLAGTQIESGDSVSISIGKVGSADLPVEVQKLIKDRPVIELKMTLGEKTLQWNNPDAPVTVSIPYVPTAEELAHPDRITVWYMDGSGAVTPVYSGRYDPKTGMVTFTTTHFSKYAVAYVRKTFTDLGRYAWAKDQIETLAAKGILNGTSKTEYSPARSISRAEFLCLLVRTLGLNAEFDANFSDVGRTAYYYNELGIAKKLGIALGGSGDRFRPNDKITRQDMIVMTVRALEKLGELKPPAAPDTLAKFNDKNLLAQYALSSAEYAVSAGLITGSGDCLNPLGNATRAEAAVILCRLYKSR
jgi:hypothetical protein